MQKKKVSEKVVEYIKGIKGKTQFFIKCSYE
jgi:hypothetical protein